MLWLSVAMLGIHAGAAFRVRQVVYDATAEFSITNGNPNGVWSYGWMPVGFGTFSLFTNAIAHPSGPIWWGWGGDYTPHVWKNLGPVSYGVPTGWLALHPGPGKEPAVLRWTAPRSGLVFVEGRFLAGDIGTMQVAVRFNCQSWWSATDSGTFSLQTNVVTGDTIDFTVFGGYHYGNTPVAATISMVSEPFLYMVREGQTNVVGFTAPGSGNYVLQFTEDLTQPVQWTDLSTNYLLAGQIFSYTESRTNQVGFYRVRRD